jgi:putative FmdB family regulatory protein
MPIYEYDCQKCGTFETTQRITDKPLGKCLTCKGKVKKLISNTSFQLKGTGWYVTDYARKGQSNGDGNGSKSSSADVTIAHLARRAFFFFLQEEMNKRRIHPPRVRSIIFYETFPPKKGWI